MVQQNGSGFNPAAIRRSVVEPERSVLPGGASANFMLLNFVASYASEIDTWGRNPTLRDRQLRQFLPMESTLLSAFATIVARNMAFSWTLDGPDLTVQATQDILHNANFISGGGWLAFNGMVSWDLMAQDKGAFIEIVREGNGPTAPPIGIQHLDAGRCWHTGVPETPVLYMDKKGRWHAMPWHNVITLREMPAPHETLYGLQYSALSRVLSMARIMQNVQTYQEEKTGGRNVRAIHVVSGVQKQELEDAITALNEHADNRGLMRYLQPLVFASLKPDIAPSVATLELASLPDNFDAEKMFKLYLTVLSMGLLTDYQELAPLPGGGLGTSQQSHILSMKAQGKGSRLFMKLLEHRFNFLGVMPRNVTFRFEEQDLDAEEQEAQIKKLRAEARKLQGESGELDPAGLRQLAVDANDIPKELQDAMDERDVTGAAPITDTGVVAPDDEAQSAKALRAGPDDERLAMEREAADIIAGGLAKVRANVRRQLRAVSE